MRDPDLWPEGLTREMFLQWFDCEVSTMIWDMLKSKIKSALWLGPERTHINTLDSGWAE